MRGAWVVGAVCAAVVAVVVWLGLGLRERGRAIEAMEKRLEVLVVEAVDAGVVTEAADADPGVAVADEEPPAAPGGGVSVEAVATEMGGVVARVLGLRAKYFGGDDEVPTLEELVASMRGVGAIAGEDPDLYAELVSEWELVMRGAMATVMKSTTASLLTPEGGVEDTPEAVAESGAAVLEAFFGEALGLGRSERRSVGRILAEGRRKVIVEGADAEAEAARMWTALEAAMGEVPYAVLGELVQGVEILGDPVGGAEILTGIGTEMVDGLLGDLGS